MMRLFLIALWATLASAQYNRVYTATMTQLGGSGASGPVTVFAASSTSVAYIGTATGVPTSLGDANCTAAGTAANACGVYIHAGTSCESQELQGDPLFVGEKYTSDSTGTSAYKGIVRQTTDQIQGRPFILYDHNGVRISCGILAEVPLSGNFPISFTSLDSFPGNTATGFVTTVANSNGFGVVCMYATVSGLPSNLDEGACSGATYSCGMNILEQSECTTADELGLPFFSDSLTEDPWEDVSYGSTDANGNTELLECVDVGTWIVESDQSFLVYDAQGAAVACGVLGRVVGPSTPPSPAPTRAPSTGTPTTATASPTRTMSPTTFTKFPTKSPAPTPGDPTPSGGDPTSSSVMLLQHGAGRLLITALFVVVAGLLV